MTFILDRYIDEFIEKAEDSYDKRVAKHLKEIIPETNHLDQKVLKKIIGELMKEMNNGKDFKKVYLKVSEEYVLKGDIIDAELPFFFTRIILNFRRFLEYLSKKIGIDVERLKKRIKSEGIHRFILSIDYLQLAPNKAVLAAFNENKMGEEPFIDWKVSDIINILALDRSVFKEGEPLSAIKVRYKNREDIDKRYPIFFDAGWYDKFYPSEKNDRYGRTRPLDKLSKGMPEIAHKNVKICDVASDIEVLKD